MWQLCLVLPGLVPGCSPATPLHSQLRKIRPVPTALHLRTLTSSHTPQALPCLRLSFAEEISVNVRLDTLRIVLPGTLPTELQRKGQEAVGLAL